MDESKSSVPYGLCHCGCGGKTRLARQTQTRRGDVRGEPIRFIKGHNGARPLAARFWSKVDRRGPDECWPWIGSTNQQGYGQIRDGTARLASRVAWEMHTGASVPEDLFVLHRCDNPPCVNPAHLFLGTLADNNRDMREKGRGCRGEKAPTAKLTEADVRNIRAQVSRGEDQGRLASAFSVSQSTISLIAAGKRWRHIK